MSFWNAARVIVPSRTRCQAWNIVSVSTSSARPMAFASGPWS